VNRLPDIDVSQFVEFFNALHGHAPFPWQKMLFERCASGNWKDGWPDLIDLPTASGKTACIDIAVFLLALQANLPTSERTAARRIWFVVNRRIVVDEAYERAKKIACALLDNPKGVLEIVAARLMHVSGTNLPLAVARLRGGVPKQLAWSYHPAQPAIITSTVDQIGSRLLFRGYGVGKLSRSIHAALAGNDSLIILDEAHTANAFRQTVAAAKLLREQQADASQRVRTPFHLIMMSATPPMDGADVERTLFPLPAIRDEALNHPLLKQRYEAAKPAELIEVGKASGTSDPLVDKAVEQAIHMATAHSRIAVMVNRVATASAIAAALRLRYPTPETGDAEVAIVLLTGRMRPIDRDELVNTWSKHLRANKPEAYATPIILVTTQCLEVGADFSFDALVTECASLDALRQRFGRLNRLGETPAASPAVILIRSDQTRDEEKIDDAKPPLDPVYDNALARTWNWLNATADIPVAGSGKKKTAATIDMGIDAVAPKIPKDQKELQKLLAPAPDAPILLPAYLDLWCQTGPTPTIEPDISLFLHGPQHGSPEAFIVFRQDLDPDRTDHWKETIELMPPVTGEKLAVPLWKLKAFLFDEADVGKASDVESERIEDDSYGRKPRAALKFILFRGKSDIQLPTNPEDIGPGDTVILPAPKQFPIELGTPGKDHARVDVYEESYRLAHAKVVQRIHPLIPTPSLDANQRIEALALAKVTDEPIDKDLLEEILGLTDRESLQYLDYPDGEGRIVFYSLKEPASDTELDPFAFDDEELLDSDHEATLQAHTNQVEKRAKMFSKPCVTDDLLASLRRAAQLHDLGKADERFQRQLNNGRRYGTLDILAKSRVKITASRWAELQELTRLPKLFRHEMVSMQLAEPTLKQEPRGDLILHLIAAHHGHGRPFAPVSIDDAPPNIEISLGGEKFAITGPARNDPPPHRVDSGIAERFWRLTRAHGWWGLAYLEALLRLADWRASKDAEERGLS
jgi:CRISPR-associated endonuclease/helicase Cas3